MSNPASASATLPEGRKLHALTFREVVSFDSRASVAIGAHGVLSIEPAVIVSGGDWVGTDKAQRADGFGIRRKVGQPRERIVRSFVPWANIADVSYGEDDAK